MGKKLDKVIIALVSIGRDGMGERQNTLAGKYKGPMVLRTDPKG